MASRHDPGRPESTTGLVVVDKERGWTSHDVVARCRRIFGQRRVGHAGTLDPDATGVLLVGLGRMTRLLRFLAPLTKHYRGDVVLGRSTTTLDDSGETTGEWDMTGVTLDDARRAAAGLTGAIEQIPPMVSAVKVDGQRLHRLARQGVEIERAPRPVVVHRFEVEGTARPGVLTIDVECSSGTFVRTLAADLGRALGGGAHLRNLRRTAVGSFTVDAARPLDRIDSDHVLTPAAALGDLEMIEVGEEVARLISRGHPLDRVPLGASGDGPWGLVGRGGELLAVYQATDTDRVTPAVVLAAH